MRFLLDSNVWLELILERAGAEAVRALVKEVPGRLLAVTHLSLDSVAMYLTPKTPEKFERFLEDLIDAQVGIVHLPPTKIRQVLRTMAAFRIDYDDAVQVETAMCFDIQIVSFDSDFDRTPRGRLTPTAALDQYLKNPTA